MARTPQVTRTIQTTTVKVLCMNTVTEQAETKEIIVPRTYESNDKLLKIVKKILDSDTLVAVHVVGVSVHAKRYGMPEARFIELADELSDDIATKADDLATAADETNN